MARILFTWELGGGLGYLYPQKLLIDELLGRGHDVRLAAKDTRLAAQVFHDTPIEIRPAPYVAPSRLRSVTPPRCYAHMLHNIGWGDSDHLGEQVERWRRLFGETRPDLMICNAAPTALTAAIDASFKTFTLGTGYMCPPPTSPLPIYDGDGDEGTAEARTIEQRLVDRINGITAGSQAPAIAALSDLFPVERSILTTFAELDHFGPRPDATYHGPWAGGAGIAPLWPGGSGPLVFAYLKPFDQLGVVFDALQASGARTLAYCPGLSDADRERWTNDRTRIESAPVDLERVAPHCDLAVLQGNMATTAQFLLAGCPSLQIPQYREQQIFARRAAAQGLCRLLHRMPAGDVAGAVRSALGDARLREAAGDFARRHGDYDRMAQVARAADRITG